MSLINDALKRATQALKRNAIERSPAEGLEPVEASVNRFGGLVKVLAAVLVAAVLGGAGWFLWKAFKPKGGAPSATAKLADQKTGGAAVQKTGGTSGPGAQAKSPAPATAKPKPERKPASTAKKGDLAASPSRQTNRSATATPPTAAATPSAEPKPVTVAKAAEPTQTPAPPPIEPPSTAVEPAPASTNWPTLKLSAIFFRLQNPSARINGKILQVGNQFEGVRVLAIERDRVKLEFAGETKELEMK